MDKNIKHIIFSALVILVITSCKKYEPPVPPSNVDFTLNLDEQANNVLKTKNKALSVNSIIIIHSSDDKYYALQQTCSYKQCNLDYLEASQILQCPCHNCMFDIAYGNVFQGPARTALRTYNTTLAGNNLRVQSK